MADARIGAGLDQIEQITAGVQTKMNPTLLLRLQQARASAGQGMPDAAREAYKDELPKQEA
jgi:hypothetical protein